jgi:adenylate cyclase class 2
MPVEIEAKMKVDDLPAVRARLVDAGAQHVGDATEINVFLDTEDRSLLAADQGLRVRSATDQKTGAHTFTATYKGPRHHGQLKSREEIEMTVGDFESAVEMFEALGFRQTLRFEKRRESWTIDGCKIELDELPLLGTFVEIEGPRDEFVLKVRERLHLHERPLVKASYVAMLMTYLQEQGRHERVVEFEKPREA